VGGTAAFWGAWILGERYGMAKARESKKNGADNNVMRNSANFETGEF
jgi:hypothetical protein